MRYFIYEVFWSSGIWENRTKEVYRMTEIIKLELREQGFISSCREAWRLLVEDVLPEMAQKELPNIFFKVFDKQSK